MSNENKIVPNCIGSYESGSVICNGNPQGNTTYDRRACLWRDKCSAFKEYLHDRKKSFEDFVDLIPMEGEDHHISIPKIGRDKFIIWCERLVIRYRIIKGIRKRLRKKKKYYKKGRRAAAKKYVENTKKKRIILDAMFEHFKTHLIENLETYRFTPPRGVVRPGRFYIIDKRNISKYVSVYYKTPGKLGIPIVHIHYRPRTVTLDIELLAKVKDFDGIGNEIMRKIHPKSIRRGRYNSICSGMDKEGAALVAQSIARMIKKGKIELPPPNWGIKPRLQ